MEPVFNGSMVFVDCSRNLQRITEYRWGTPFELFEYITKVFGIRKTGHGGYFLDTEGTVDQQVGSVVDAQDLQIFDRCGTIYLIEIPPELGVGQIGNMTKGGYGHLRLGKMLVHVVNGMLDGAKSRGVVSGRALLIQLAENGVKQGHAFVVMSGTL